ncbi:unnamed protein product [Lactuca virosa]|uniref:Uncharacterized protein n=1 Tax=Lactuca virosa TaxID=75947 RepID=A0AAU9NKH1_9ASTR|nr:unnamed protein product [Lactuca virosa]
MLKRLYRLIVIPGTRRMSLINTGSVTRIWLNQYFLSAVPRDHPLPFLGCWCIGLKEEMFLVDAGLGTAKMSMQDEPKGVPINRATRFFMDLVAGESLIKERAAARFNDLVGSTDAVAGEPLLLLPRRFTQN